MLDDNYLWFLFFYFFVFFTLYTAVWSIVDITGLIRAAFNLKARKDKISEGEQILFPQPPTKKLCDEDLVKHIYYTHLLQIKALNTFTKLYNLRKT